MGHQMHQLSGDRDSGLLFAMTLIGISCGLAATLSIGAIFLVVFAIFRFKDASSFLFQQPIFILLSAFLIQIACWNFPDSLSWWPNNSSSSLIWLAYLIPGTLAVVWVTSTRTKQLAGNDNADPKSEMTGDSNESGTQ